MEMLIRDQLTVAILRLAEMLKLVGNSISLENYRFTCVASQWNNLNIANKC